MRAPSPKAPSQHKGPSDGRPLHTTRMPVSYTHLAVLVLDLTALNAGQGLAQTLHDGAGGLVTVREDDDLSLIHI